MREIKIVVPDGWFIKFATAMLGAALFFVFGPFWLAWGREYAAKSEARAKVESAKILGECNGLRKEDGIK